MPLWLFYIVLATYILQYNIYILYVGDTIVFHIIAIIYIESYIVHYYYTFVLCLVLHTH